MSLVDQAFELFDNDYSTREDLAKRHGFGEDDQTQNINGVGRADFTRFDNGNAKVSLSPDAIPGMKLDASYSKKPYLPQMNFESAQIAIIDGSDAADVFKLGGDNIQGSPLSGGISVELSPSSAGQLAVLLENITNPEYIKDGDWNQQELVQFVKELQSADGEPALQEKNAQDISVNTSEYIR